MAYTTSAIMTHECQQRIEEMRPKYLVTFAPWLAVAAAFIPLCAHSTAGAEAETDAQNNDFPTLARVEYVLRCMDYHGGQVYENMYSCVCSLDRIAGQFSYDEFVRAEVLAQLRTTPGERGGLFREGGRELVSRYFEVTEAAEKTCFSAADAPQG